MRPHRGLLTKLTAKAHERGKTIDEVRPCIIGMSGDGKWVTVDLDHPAYPKPLDKPRTPRRFMPGDLLMLLIAKLGYVKTSGCNCEAWRQKMNGWGWLGCWWHRKEIAAHLVGEAAKAGVKVESATVFALMKSAIKEARRRR